MCTLGAGFTDCLWAFRGWINWPDFCYIVVDTAYTLEGFEKGVELVGVVIGSVVCPLDMESLRQRGRRGTYQVGVWQVTRIC